MSPVQGTAEIVVSPPYRYTVICWRDDCPEGLDTYGGEEVLELARAHVERNGCTLRVEAKAIIDVRPSANMTETRRYVPELAGDTVVAITDTTVDRTVRRGDRFRPKDQRYRFTVITVHSLRVYEHRRGGQAAAAHVQRSTSQRRQSIDVGRLVRHYEPLQ